LDEAVEGYEVVRSTLMRLTLHLVHAEDYRAFREGMEPTLRGSRLHDPRYKAAGFTADDADALLPALLDYAGEARSGARMRERLEAARGAPVEAVVWRMMRQYAPLWHAPTGPPWSFGAAQSFVTASAPLPVLGDPEAATAGLAVLIRRYLEGFGPASVPDMAQFTLAPRGKVREAVRLLEGELERLEGPDGILLYDVPGALRPEEDVPAPPRLLAMWDSVLLAYADRSRVIPAEYRKHVIRVNGDTLPTLLVDGYVAGVWRPVAPAWTRQCAVCLCKDGVSIDAPSTGERVTVAATEEVTLALCTPLRSLELRVQARAITVITQLGDEALPRGGVCGPCDARVTLREEFTPVRGRPEDPPRRLTRMP
ncbi:winged helix DNA-binding domain-containing protein, partial [Streptomyces massasporeus]